VQRPIAEFAAAASSDVVERVQPAELLNGFDHCTLCGLGMSGVANHETRQITKPWMCQLSGFGIAADHHKTGTRLFARDGRRKPHAAGATNN
jgi:hypothetical protein